MRSKRLSAAVLSIALLMPATSSFAATKHVRRHRHHYSQTRGAVIGAVAGAAINHKKPLKGALVGAAAGEVVQAIRNHNQ